MIKEDGYFPGSVDMNNKLFGPLYEDEIEKLMALYGDIVVVIAHGGDEWCSHYKDQVIHDRLSNYDMDVCIQCGRRWFVNYEKVLKQ